MLQGADLLALSGPHLGQEELAALYHRGADLLVGPHLANERRVVTVLTNERREVTVLTNERTVVTLLTNERTVVTVLTKES